MKNKGFSLLELMVGIAVLAVMVGVAIPSYLTMIQNNRLTSQLNSMLGGLQYARSEAIKLHETVGVCKKNAASTACDNSVGWEDGWLVWGDVDSDGVVDAGETILRVVDGFDNENDVFPSLSVANSISFNSRGVAAIAGSWQICDDRGAPNAKAVVIGLSGRAKVAETTHIGGALTCS